MDAGISLKASPAASPPATGGAAEGLLREVRRQPCHPSPAPPAPGRAVEDRVHMQQPLVQELRELPEGPKGGCREGPLVSQASDSSSEGSSGAEVVDLRGRLGALGGSLAGGPSLHGLPGSVLSSLLEDVGQAAHVCSAAAPPLQGTLQLHSPGGQAGRARPCLRNEAGPSGSRHRSC